MLTANIVISSIIIESKKPIDCSVYLLYSKNILTITGIVAISAQLDKKQHVFYTNNVVGKLDKNKEAELIINLEDSKAVLVSYHLDDPNVGMSLTKNVSIFYYTSTP